MATASVECTDFAYVLRLDQDEAETLAKLCRRVGGDPLLSRRKDVDAISDALVRSGIDPSELDGIRIDGGVMFPNLITITERND